MALGQLESMWSWAPHKVQRFHGAGFSAGGVLGGGTGADFTQSDDSDWLFFSAHLAFFVADSSPASALVDCRDVILDVSKLGCHALEADDAAGVSCGLSTVTPPCIRANALLPSSGATDNFSDVSGAKSVCAEPESTSGGCCGHGLARACGGLALLLLPIALPVAVVPESGSGLSPDAPAVSESPWCSPAAVASDGCSYLTAFAPERCVPLNLA